MAATIQIVRLTGSGPTVTDITGFNTRANAVDAHSTNDTASPIQIPPSGSNYSFKVSTQLNAVSSPTTQINNIRWYTDGVNSFGTGVTMQAKSSSSYTQATGSAGTGTQMAGGADAFTYTSGSPLSVSGSITNPSTGRFGNIVEYQLVVDSTAAAGPTGSETLTWKYDES
jgi:hypothetical protein